MEGSEVKLPGKNTNVEDLANAFSVPDRLPILTRGGHSPNEQQACAMEAASWLAGEHWSAHPHSVHPVIASIARQANDELDDEQRQALWPLVLASLGTARRFRFRLYGQLRRVARNELRARRTAPRELREVWAILLEEHVRLTGHQSVGVPRSRVTTLSDHLLPPDV
jgi:hypothetical protein